MECLGEVQVFKRNTVSTSGYSDMPAGEVEHSGEQVEGQSTWQRHPAVDGIALWL